MKAMTKMTGGKRNKERIDAWDIYTRYSDEEIVEIRFHQTHVVLDAI